MDKIKPTKRQLEFMDWEFGIFFHYGIRTYYENHKDWDGEPMAIEGFKPSWPDCFQWIKCAKEAGAKYAVLVTKHHDGFANWPSKYTDYSVANTGLKDIDIVRDFTEACREYGLKIGLYYSPAEFGSRDRDDYDDYFINQISELLTGYGKIDYLWFDGCGSEGHEYDKKRIITAIRSMQPEILIFNMWDPDTRWVGNEDGFAPETNINVVDNVAFSVMTDKADVFSEKKFLPAECDCRIRDNWFFSSSDRLKSVNELMDIYERSVGHGANLLLNIGPDRRGLINEADAKILEAFGEEIRNRYASPLIESEKSHIKLSSVQTIDRIILCEDIENGQGITDFTVSVKRGSHEKVVFEGTTVGHKRICKFSPVCADTVKVSVNGGRIKNIAVFKN